MDNKQKTNLPPEKVQVIVNLDKQVIPMADYMTSVRESNNRSDYIRQLIRADYRRHIRRQQRAQAQS